MDIYDYHFCKKKKNSLQLKKTSLHCTVLFIFLPLAELSALSCCFSTCFIFFLVSLLNLKTGDFKFFNFPFHNFYNNYFWHSRNRKRNILNFFFCDRWPRITYIILKAHTISMVDFCNFILSVKSVKVGCIAIITMYDNN